MRSPDRLLQLKQLWEITFPRLVARHLVERAVGGVEQGPSREGSADCMFSCSFTRRLLVDIQSGGDRWQWA